LIGEITRLFSRLYAFIRLGRPLFLVGGFIFHALGVTIALYRGTPLNPAAYLWGQLCISAIQWMTHYSNDYFDLEADRANQTPTNWSGGSRVLPNGLISPQSALRMAQLLALIAIAAGLIVAVFIVPAPLTMPLLALALFLAWFYSAPPLRLHSRGIGELSGAILIPGLTPLVGFYLQTQHVELLPFLAIFPLCCLQFAMLLAIEFPDAAGDEQAGKCTLVVRLGARNAARLYCAILLLPYFSLPLLVIAGLPPLVALAFFLLLPLTLSQLWRIYRGDYANPAHWNTFGFFSIALFFASAVVETITFALMYAVSIS